MMGDKPIIIQAEAVRAILAGTKTMTRRVIKPQPDHCHIFNDGVGLRPQIGLKEIARPYAIGQTLWVRETMRENDEGNWCYAADDEWVGVNREDEGRMLSWVMHTERTTCPSIHMPRWASRITLAVTGVRVERVNEISRQDAIAEGIGLHKFARGLLCDDWHPQKAFQELWDSINGERGYPFDSGCWVWVVEFKRVK